MTNRPLDFVLNHPTYKRIWLKADVKKADQRFQVEELAKFFNKHTELLSTEFDDIYAVDKYFSQQCDSVIVTFPYRETESRETVGSIMVEYNKARNMLKLGSDYQSLSKLPWLGNARSEYGKLVQHIELVERNIPSSYAIANHI